jgi:hypothetical protein
MIHPSEVGCKPEYRWKGRERCIRWYHCERGDVTVRQTWDAEKETWTVVIQCRTCGKRWEG